MTRNRLNYFWIGFSRSSSRYIDSLAGVGARSHVVVVLCRHWAARDRRSCLMPWPYQRHVPISFLYQTRSRGQNKNSILNPSRGLFLNIRDRYQFY